MFKNSFSELTFKGVQDNPGVPLLAKLVQASTINSHTAKFIPVDMEEFEKIIMLLHALWFAFMVGWR